MTVARCLLVVSLLVGALFLCACIRQPSGFGDVEVLRAGEIAGSANTMDVAEVVYVLVHDKTNRFSALRSHVEAAVRADGFTVSDAPGQAGYVVQVTALAVGVTNSETLRTLVNAGYGASATLSGVGATGLLADVLLVQRRVPVSRRQNLKNIAGRSAVTSSRMRLGLLARREVALAEGVPQSVLNVLADELSAVVSVKARGESPKGMGARGRMLQ
ncbi:MAG: conserved hypothetical protein [Candidatus Desulfovibrio kirbyi]|jgi:hypothetical protein|uniref:Uncharacterized protein n=1 Tax=Candidatus Desulfovibrio kirbyi TaxID=2696086 RepID=A0A6L2R6Y3_9BACT|nr:complement resistance protein TraT [Desulfovibrio sp.]GFH63293.1 MAG: conserved hypothetical protein [Candidatus Desulfovibrio kirbyi]